MPPTAPAGPRHVLSCSWPPLSRLRRAALLPPRNRLPGRKPHSPRLRCSPHLPTISFTPPPPLTPPPAALHREKDPKRVYYLSMEFLMGRSLLNTLYNLDIKESYQEALAELG